MKLQPKAAPALDLRTNRNASADGVHSRANACYLVLVRRRLRVTFVMVAGALPQNLIRDSAVQLFGLARRLGIHRLPGFHRTFLMLYPIYKRYFEAGPIDRLRAFVPAGSLVIDVGANVGFFTLRFADWTGSEGKVIAIEPEEQNYSSLIAALKRADLLGRVETLKAVAAAESGMTHLELNPLHPADHKLSRDGAGHPVNAVTLDALVLDKGPSRPALVKIDVQGAEILVLRGMTQILHAAGPALFVELSEQGLNMYGASVSAVLGLLSENGYEAFWLTRSGHEKADRSDIEAKARADYVDVLFIRTTRPGPSA
jgi:FkbM family methyltransferase